MMPGMLQHGGGGARGGGEQANEWLPARAPSGRIVGFISVIKRVLRKLGKGKTQMDFSSRRGQFPTNMKIKRIFTDRISAYTMPYSIDGRITLLIYNKYNNNNICLQRTRAVLK
jgi:hypothetical protein